MNWTTRILTLLTALLLLPVPSQAGTRLFRSLEDVLRGPNKFVVFSATVAEAKFSRSESYDIMNCGVENVEMLRNDANITKNIEDLQFLAYRPAPTSRMKNRSVYSNGSGLEFALEDGKRYIFICASSRALVRVESLDNEKRVLELLAK